MNNYYVCDCAAHKALHGPWTSAAVVQWINSQPNPKLFCNMSNCMLAQAVVNYIDTAMRNSSPTPLRQSLFPEKHYDHTEYTRRKTGTQENSYLPCMESYSHFYEKRQKTLACSIFRMSSNECRAHNISQRPSLRSLQLGRWRGNNVQAYAFCHRVWTELMSHDRESQK